MGFKKGEKITDPVVLERLQKAREKALAKRKEQTENKKTLQLSKELDAHQALSTAKEKLAKAKQPEAAEDAAVIEKSAPVTVKKKKYLRQ